MLSNRLGLFLLMRFCAIGFAGAVRLYAINAFTRLTYSPLSALSGLLNAGSNAAVSSRAPHGGAAKDRNRK